MYFIVRRVVTRARDAPVKYWNHTTFWTGLENGFGCRHFAKSYSTVDDAVDGTCDVVAFYYDVRKFNGMDVEVVQETSPGVYEIRNGFE